VEALAGVKRAHRTAYESVDVDAQDRRWPGEMGEAGGRERARHEVAALTRRAAFQINRRFY